MFDKKVFSEILNRIYKTYPNQREFANATGVNRGYLSQYMNLKLDNPPSPKKLKGIANASKGITNYDELMQICGHIATIEKVSNSLQNSANFFTVPIYTDIEGKLQKTKEDVALPKNIDTSKQYIGYMIKDNSMAPLLDIGDIAIIQKQDTFKNGQTCLFSIDKKTLLIRKIIDFGDYIELYTIISFGNADMKLSKEEMKKRNFTILGRVIKSENNSAFK